jgi:hypothetical protein
LHPKNFETSPLSLLNLAPFSTNYCAGE